MTSDAELDALVAHWKKHGNAIPADVVTALRQERDAALADARRYRWLRSAKTGKPISCVTTGSAWRCTLNTVELDAAIDAALAGSKHD